MIPLLVGLSRFCVGVHFPTDVLFGWALGLFVVLVVPFFQKKFEKRWVFYLILLLLMLPGWFYCKTNDYFNGFGMTVGFFAGDLFEEKFVKFKNTKCWWKIILRVLGGGAIYFGLNTLLKMRENRKTEEHVPPLRPIYLAYRQSYQCTYMTSLMVIRSFLGSSSDQRLP